MNRSHEGFPCGLRCPLFSFWPLPQSSSWRSSSIEQPFKVSIVRRLINDIAPDAQVTAFVGNALDEEVLDALLTCDLVLGCTDTQHGRALLGDLAKIDEKEAHRPADRRLKRLIALFQHPDLRLEG